MSTDFRATAGGDGVVEADTIETDSLETDSFTLDGSAITQVANQADSVAADTAAMVVDFNLLLDKLKAAGIMVAD